MNRVHIRWLIRLDMPEVLAIEAASLARPWGEDEFLRVLRRRNCIGMVAERDDKVLGYMVYELHGFRVQLLALAVHPDHRRAGVGRELATKLKLKLSAGRRTRARVVVPETSLGAQLFFRAVGFRALGVIREHFPGDEDGYDFSYALPAAEPATMTADLEHEGRDA